MEAPVSETTKDDRILDRISTESVREATGLSWDEWLEALDEAGAAAWDHKATVAWLADEHGGSTTGWWRQSITVAYEQARGKRVVGETADTGFQLGVQRTVEASASDTWELLVSRPELWLGEGVSFGKGERYETGEAAGEIRVVRPGDRLRLTWRPTGWEAPATLQLTVQQSRPGKTVVGVHLEKLPDADARDAMRERWRAALDRIEAETERSAS
jgi:uncharacterized protein YndB with AHSA1/START domain